MGLQKRNIGKIPVYFGDWNATQKYDTKNRVTLYGSEFESKIDNNINHAPATYNSTTHVVTFDTDRWYIISNGTDAYFAAQRMDVMEGRLDVHDTSIGSMQEQIDNLIAGGTSIAFTATPNVVFINVARSITVKSVITTTGVIKGHQILKGGTAKATGASASLTYVDENVTLSANQSYDSSVNINGIKLPQKTATVTVVYPIYYGSGTNYDDFITNKVMYPNAVTSPARTYNVTVRGANQHVYFAVPEPMVINEVYLGKLKMTMNPMYTKTVNIAPYGSHTYRIYESFEPYNPVTMELTVS